jgi:2-polyprenyl-3-methyl-5-hydroxy-6-metoxy-1,4-benzoquinol methylase
MKQRHKYEYKVDLNGSSAQAAVVRMVGKNKRVLEIGAGPGSITRVLKEHSCCRVTGIELDDEAIRKLSPFCEHVYRCDLNDQAWTLVIPHDEKFNVVVAADVLEHLYYPQATLRAVKDILDNDGYVVVSLPHIGHNAVIGCLLNEDLEFQDGGLLDKTHIQFFGIKNMQRLFNNAGFKIVDVEFILLPPDQTELAYFWRNISEELKRGLMSNRFGMVYQVVIKAQPDPSLKDGLRILSLPIPTPESTIPKNTSFVAKVVFLIKKNILPHLHPRTRSRLRNFLYRVGLRF